MYLHENKISFIIKLRKIKNENKKKAAGLLFIKLM